MDHRNYWTTKVLCKTVLENSNFRNQKFAERIFFKVQKSIRRFFARSDLNFGLSYRYVNISCFLYENFGKLLSNDDDEFSISIILSCDKEDIEYKMYILY